MTDLLESERILLRPLALSDAKHFARLLGPDPVGTRMTSSIPYPCTEEAARNWIARRMAPGFGRVFAITHAENGEFLGAAAFGGPPKEIGIGYWVGRPYRGYGIATEAVHLVLDYVAGFGVHRMFAEAFSDNAASVRVLSKAGFRFLGKRFRDFPVCGGLHEVKQYTIELHSQPYQSIGNGLRKDEGRALVCRASVSKKRRLTPRNKAPVRAVQRPDHRRMGKDLTRIFARAWRLASADRIDAGGVRT